MPEVCSLSQLYSSFNHLSQGEKVLGCLVAVKFVRLCSVLHRKIFASLAAVERRNLTGGRHARSLWAASFVWALCCVLLTASKRLFSSSKFSAKTHGLQNLEALKQRAHLVS